MPTLNFVWDGHPKPAILPEYRAWAMTVISELANHWGTKIAYALGVSEHETELWAFEPGKAPELIENCGGIFD